VCPLKHIWLINPIVRTLLCLTSLQVLHNTMTGFPNSEFVPHSKCPLPNKVVASEFLSIQNSIHYGIEK